MCGVENGTLTTTAGALANAFPSVVIERVPVLDTCASEVAGLMGELGASRPSGFCYLRHRPLEALALR